jgi:hypothetical protein
MAEVGGAAERWETVDQAISTSTWRRGDGHSQLRGAALVLCACALAVLLIGASTSTGGTGAGGVKSGVGGHEASASGHSGFESLLLRVQGTRNEVLRDHSQTSLV